MPSPDDYSLKTSPHPAGLRVEVRGPSSYDNTLAYWRAIVTEVQSRRPDGLLLVDYLRGEPLAAADWQSLVGLMRGSGLESVRIAHVKPLGLQQVEHCQIFATEAGFDAQVFSDEAQADLWLRHGER